MVADNTSKQIAHKTSIRQIILAPYIVGDEKNPNHFLINNEPIYKVNLIAFVINKEIVGSISNLLLDDGTGRIISRFFEENKVAMAATVGDVLLFVGRVRMYNQERYLSPEIVKKVDKQWLQVRKQECREAFEEIKIDHKGQGEILQSVDEEVVEEQDHLLPSQKIARLIRDLDNGMGVFIEEVIEKSPLQQTEQILEKMMERGEIFQNQPGKVKVL